MSNQQTERIKELCLKIQNQNPIQIARTLMQDPLIHMHGPEHHILDGAALLTALHNTGLNFSLEEALDELIRRGSQMPGAICGQWGVCGSAASVGAALAIVHQTGPLSDNAYYKENLLLASRALANIAEVGGPRCCKRNAFISLKTAIQFLKEKEGICLEDETVHCEFYPRNAQCLKEKCPFYPKTA